MVNSLDFCFTVFNTDIIRRFWNSRCTRFGVGAREWVAGIKNCSHFEEVFKSCKQTIGKGQVDTTCPSRRLEFFTCQQSTVQRRYLRDLWKTGDCLLQLPHKNWVFLLLQHLPQISVTEGSGKYFHPVRKAPFCFLYEPSETRNYV